MAEKADRFRSRVPLLILVLLAAAQVFWLIGEFGAERRVVLERQGVDPDNELTTLLRHETESAQRHLAIVRSQAEIVLKERVRERVDEAVAIAQAIHDQAAGHMPQAEIRALVREALRSPRFFDGRGYYFVDGMDGTCVLLPTAPRHEGGSLLDNRDDAGRYIMRELIRAVGGPEQSGYVRYSWYPPGVTDRMDDKIAYARQFKPFDWLIGTGDYVSAVEDGLKADALERLRAVRLTRGGRLVVIDNTGIVRLVPGLPTLEGVKVDDLPAGPDAEAIRAIWLAGREGAASARFTLTDGETGRPRTWLAWAQAEPTFGWVMAATAAAADLDSLPAEPSWRWIGRYGVPLALLLTAILWAVFNGFVRDRDSDES